MYKNYNMNQLVLPLDLEIKLQPNDIAFSINHLVESIPEEAFASFLRQTGCPAYHPKMMLKLLLCGYSQSAFSGRKIEDMTRDSIRMMWLAQGYEPSYRTINRFRAHPQVQILLKQCFIQFRCQLVEQKIIGTEAIFIDGTKIEANANKFTFVWKKSVEKYQENLIKKSNQIYEELVEKQIIPAIKREDEEQLTLSELEEVANHLEEKVKEYTTKIEESTCTTERKLLRFERKTPKQLLKQISDFLSRKEKYKNDLLILGSRNSYSKTDPDATFMRMKDDYMQNGQLKAGYNIQIATQGQYSLAYGVYSNPTDTKTLIPFLEEIEMNYFELPKHIVADAGYGSEANYNNILQRDRVPLITYNQYRNERKRKNLKDPFNTNNWNYNIEEDSFTCPNNNKLVYKYPSIRTDNNGFTRHLKVYECEECGSCPLKSHCTKATGNRKIRINTNWEQQKEYVRSKLSEAKTGEIYRQRKIDVEPVFGFLKANLGFTRFSLRGKPKVETEIGLALMATNIRKLVANS